MTSSGFTGLGAVTLLRERRRGYANMHRGRRNSSSLSWYQGKLDAGMRILMDDGGGRPIAMVGGEFHYKTTFPSADSSVRAMARLPTSRFEIFGFGFIHRRNLLI